MFSGTFFFSLRFIYEASCICASLIFMAIEYFHFVNVSMYFFIHPSLGFFALTNITAVTSQACLLGYKQRCPQLYSRNGIARSWALSSVYNMMNCELFSSVFTYQYSHQQCVRDLPDPYILPWLFSDLKILLLERCEMVCGLGLPSLDFKAVEQLFMYTLPLL